MGIFDKFKTKTKKVSIAVGGVYSVELTIKQHPQGSYEIPVVKIMDERVKGFFIEETLADRLFKMEGNFINLDNPKILEGDKEKSRLAKSCRKMLDNNIDTIVDTFKKDKEKLKMMLDNDAISSNAAREKAKTYFEVPKGFALRTIYSLKNSIDANLESLKYHDKPAAVVEKPRKEEKKEEKERKEIFQYMDALTQTMLQMQKEIVALRAGEVLSEQTATQEKKTEVKAETKTPEDTKAPKNTIKGATHLDEFKKRCKGEIQHIHKQIKEQMIKETGYQKEDYEGGEGINTILKNALKSLEKIDSVEDITPFKQQTMVSLENSYRRAAQHRASQREEGVVQMTPTSEASSIAVQELQSKNIEPVTINEKTPPAMESAAQGGHLGDFSNIDTTEADMGIDDYIEENEKEGDPSLKPNG